MYKGAEGSLALPGNSSQDAELSPPNSKSTTSKEIQHSGMINPDFHPNGTSDELAQLGLRGVKATTAILEPKVVTRHVESADKTDGLGPVRNALSKVARRGNLSPALWLAGGLGSVVGVAEPGQLPGEL